MGGQGVVRESAKGKGMMTRDKELKTGCHQIYPAAMTAVQFLAIDSGGSPRVYVVDPE
jgi:hypothetical protein